MLKPVHLQQSQPQLPPQNPEHHHPESTNQKRPTNPTKTTPHHPDSGFANLNSPLVPPDRQKPTMSKEQRQSWIRDHIPTEIQLMLDTPHGKPSSQHSFTSEVQFRHIIPLLHSSKLLSSRTKKRLASASRLYRQYQILHRKYGSIDFRPLRLGIPKNMTGPEAVFYLQNLTTACMLHYNCNVPAVVRYIGNQHTNAHMNVDDITSRLARANLPTHLIDQLRNLVIHGAPTRCVATSTEENFRAFLRKGNSSTIYQDTQLTKKAFEKDLLRGFTIATDSLLVMFTPHLHLTPISMCNVGHPWKKARPVFDSTSRPNPTCTAINDMVDNANEPPLYFPEATKIALTWVWNLRISHPTKEIYLSDDDVSSAFRRVKYNPELVALHACLVFGVLFMMTGQTFGDSPSPPNWEVFARARQLYAQWLWQQDDTLARGRALMPSLTYAAPPVLSIVNTWPVPFADSFNKGVIDENGKRQPPPYSTHVDDCYHADIKEHHELTATASMLALHDIFGGPSEHNPDPTSWDKYLSLFTHKRIWNGFLVDSRNLTVELPTHKRNQVVTQLGQFLSSQNVTLRDIAQTLGQLNDITRICTWGKTRFAALLADFRRFLFQRYQQTKGYLQRIAHNTRQQYVNLPNNIAHRLKGIISRDQAHFFWNNRVRFTIPHQTKQQLDRLREYLRDPSKPWQISIGYLIPRDPFACNTGDASHSALGGYNPILQYWYLMWHGPELRRRCSLSPSDPDYTHINELEFIVVLIAMAATITRLREPIPHQLQAAFPNGYPHAPILHTRTDNTSTKCWATQVSTRSRSAQPLVDLLSNLLEAEEITNTSSHISGSDNFKADFISRPTSHSIPHHILQIYQTLPETKSWNCFQPSPMLTSAIMSRLFSDAKPAQFDPKESLGRFEPVGSTISCFVTA